MKTPWALTALCVLAAATILLWWLWGNGVLPTLIFNKTGDNAQEMGAWGDFFGPISALFSGLSFAGVIFTLFYQISSFRKQEYASHRDRFEATFFQMIELLNKSRNEITIGPPVYQSTFRGYEAISNIVRIIKESDYINSFSFYMEDEDSSKLLLSFEFRSDVFDAYHTIIGPYFRIMYNILRIIYSDDVLREPDKIFYANLFRASLNADELALTALNGLMPESADLSKYIRHFHLLKYYPTDTGLGQTMREKRIYPPEAFAAREDGSETPRAWYHFNFCCRCRRKGS
ncbi:Putative phage abortive infection protein [Pseudoxanthobacter soli DSM 19599]|uniref:Putative phage abortive infection protein n=1 Tax=Pseudoxanthobacter soli DSM 19599 TaxID=1123029 RepID=A0A1M7ZLT7_9HYPH|nr:putative phage abortive infection protein [Pseudoxanthobacter soli]SHO65841.1 Putative phage abortive infection protein [Pseudoxanthobacter soli DSM 19599]